MNPKSIKTAWQSEMVQEYRKKHIDGNYEEIKLCKKCNEWGDIEEISIYRKLTLERLNLIF